ncbi:MAG TPA: S8 family serine peptidase [Thermoanaerobaculia bacterium]|jgi:hypothetical protein
MPLLALLLALAVPAPKAATDRVPVIVEYRIAAPESTRARLSTLHGRLRRDASAELRHEYSRVFRGAALTVTRARIEELRALPYVKSVHEDREMKALADHGSVARIGAERFWAQLGKQGEGIVVAVIDSGIDPKHERFAGRIAGGYDFVGQDDDPTDGYGHGTHVAGTVLDVAPAARLLSYRVLGDNGGGMSSDVIAAIERAVDPNQDGDLSDRAHIINLSLGSSFSYVDDPTIAAVENAVATGVIACVAAGNDGVGQFLGTPAAAAGAITVGATDGDDRLASFSSRGPVHVTLTMKPEVVAPGVDIRSAKVGGGTVVYSGTSMATPHVAGACALLLSLRPELTPMEVKALLVTTAVPIDTEVMAQGGGRIDVRAAASALTTASPALVAFGRSRPVLPEWDASQTVRVTNYGEAAASFALRTPSQNGIAVTAEPSTFALGPKESRDVVLTIQVNNAAAGAPSLDTLTFGGRITVTADGQPAGQIPWTFVKAAKAVVTSDELGAFVSLWKPGYWTRSIYHARGIEALVPEGTYDVICMSQDRVIVRRETVTDDLTLALSQADAPHRVRLAGVDDTGRTLSSYGGNAVRLQHFRIVTPEAGYTLQPTGAPELRISDLPRGMRLLAAETLFEPDRNRLLVVQHQPVYEPHGTVVLTNERDFRRATVRFDPVAVPEGAAWLGMGRWLNRERGSDLAALPVADGRLAATWRGELLTTPDVDPDSAFSAGFQAGWPAGTVAAPVLRARGDRTWFSDELVPSPAAVDVREGVVAFGLAPAFPRPFVGTLGSSVIFSGHHVGPHGDARRGTPGVVRFFDGVTGALLETQEVPEFIQRFETRGPLRVEWSSVFGEATSTFDTSREDARPPEVTSMRFVDGNGAVVTHLEPNAPAALLLSAGDFRDEGGVPVSRPFDAAATRVFWRTEGGEWQPLPLTVIAEDSGMVRQLGHIATGTHYRADVSGIARTARGAIDLRIEVTDGQGNTTAMTVRRATTVQAAARRRAA